MNDTGGAYKYDSISKYIPGTDSVLVAPKDILIASYSKMQVLQVYDVKKNYLFSHHFNLKIYIQNGD